MTKFWETFWSDYGPEHAVTEDDLFRQVAQTREGRSISKELFNQTLDHIEERLELSPKDHLIDLCCGNGLVSYELAVRVAYVTGIDFVPRNIRTAKEQKQAENITYILNDITSPISILIGKNTFPEKFLMNYSLGYFGPSQFDVILSNIVQHMADRPFRFLLTGIPCFDLKWNFYNTEERVARHLESEKKRKDINDGVGRWWKAGEIEGICSQHGLRVQATNQPRKLSNFRMDALVTSYS